MPYDDEHLWTTTANSPLGIKTLLEICADRSLKNIEHHVKRFGFLATFFY